MMASSSGTLKWFAKGMENVLKGEVDFTSDTFKVLLTTSTYSPNQGTHADLTSVTNEVSGTGYSAGGAALALSLSYDGTLRRWQIRATDVVWENSTISGARVAVIYKVGVSDATSLLLGYSVFAADTGSSEANYILDFDDVDGILHVDLA